MFNIIERLDKNIFEPCIAVNEEGGALFDEIKSKGYTIIVHRFSAEGTPGIYNQLKEARRLAGYFKPLGFKIWQSFNWSSDYSEALIAKLSGARYVYVKKNMNWNRKAWKVKSALASAIVARNTTMIETIFANLFYKGKTHYIPGAVDTGRFYKIQSTFRETLNLPAGATLISCVAQVVKVKDQATLIRAIAGIEDAYLVLAGRLVDDVYVQQLKQLIEELGLEKRVLLQGGVNDINGLLNASDIFVLPTSKFGGHEEGCPVALLEAMAAQVPCIASDVAGNRDLIVHEKAGLLFTPGNVNELQQCIKWYIADKQLMLQMAGNAFATVNKKYLLSIEAKNFEDLYLKLSGKV